MPADTKNANYSPGNHLKTVAVNKTTLQKLREQLLKPKQLSKREILRRQKLREQKALAKHQLLRNHLLKAGIGASPQIMSKWIFRIWIFMNVLVAGYSIYNFADFFKFGFLSVLILIVITWAAAFLFILFLLWLTFYVMIDLLIYKRRVGLEEVLPDFLLLASANIRAGMPIDRALWYAVRPRFGVLAKEIEMVAKETMSGSDLETALHELSARYDSPVLKNTVSLLIESINAGGEIGNLLSRISSNIRDNFLMRKEMAAGISAYVIFIAVAAVIIAPILFALSSQLLVVITGITGSIDIPKGVSVPIFSLGLGQAGVKQQDFLVFAVVNMFLTSLFSALIVTIIRKGEIRAGVKAIPLFIATSLIIFFVTQKLFSAAFSGIF